jgi:hypothetical protein
MVKLRDLLTGKELEIYKKCASFVTPRFGSAEDETRYYAELWTAKPSSRVVFDEATAMNRPIIKGKSDIYALTDEQKTPKAVQEFIAQTLGDIERLRDGTAIAYFTAYGNYERSDVALNNDDKNALLTLLAELPHKKDRLDLIIHSPGGLTETAEEIVELLRDNFSEVNFLIPDKAMSAAAMMAMSANEIILYDGAILGPYDPQISLPNKRYAPIPFAVRSALKGSLPNWTVWEAGRVITQAGVYKKYCETLAALWLTKYMFGRGEVKIWRKDSLFRFLRSLYVKCPPEAQDDYKKALKIVSFFMDYDLHPTHTRPLPFSRISDLGLNVSKAEGELKALMREAYMLSLALFDSPNTNHDEYPYHAKIWCSTSSCQTFFGQSSYCEKTANNR